MDKKAKELLRLFQCDFNRSIEENFAQTLSENENVRLFFINENEAFTDGKNIVVDPGIGGSFSDKRALQHTENFMKLEHRISSNPWYALRIMTRGQTIHECLHLLYSNFPIEAFSDPRADTKIRKKVLVTVQNVIEDAFIEAAGCSVFDNLEFFLLFSRLATLFSRTPFQGTVDRNLQGILGKKPFTEILVDKMAIVISYLNYMLEFLLYPMVIQRDPPPEYADYVEKTKPLFLDGSICGDPGERYTYSQRIFDIIEPLIPDTDQEPEDSYLEEKLPGNKTHNSETIAISNVKNKGCCVDISRRLFSDLEGNSLENPDLNNQMLVLIDGFEADREKALKIVLVEPMSVTWSGRQFDCHNMHNHIKLIETKPKPNLNLRKAYQNIYNKYRIQIHSYNGRFTQLLKAWVPAREEKVLFGAGISSHYLGDPKKRYWYRNGEEYGIPEISVLLLIDGSGSMTGIRRESAMVACVILHEVLKDQGISHAIVEHRAVYGKSEVEHTILIDFDGKNEEKYNILALEAYEGTREGLSLYWAERYIMKKENADKRLIIALSDGEPAHVDANGMSYYPPVSVKDTANAVKKIMKRGTDIIAVALDEGGNSGCYDDLKEIYPSVIECTNPARLPSQLLGIVSKYLQ